MKLIKKVEDMIIKLGEHANGKSLYISCHEIIIPQELKESLVKDNKHQEV